MRGIRSAPISPAECGATSLRATRDALVARVVAGELRADELPARYATAADAWLSDLLDAATGRRTRGLALVAVGGYGRQELCPASDLDLVLLHKRRRDHDEVARKLWYAIWDEGLRLDYSVRTRSEALAVAREDLKAVLGMLDGRVVAGDPKVAEPVLDGASGIWRKQQELLVELSESVRTRHRDFGELAFLLEPDLKQSAGGLRDLAALRALLVAMPELASLLQSRNLDEHEHLVLSARVALHCRTGGPNDRLLLQEQDEVARILGLGDADELMAAIAEAGRAITATSSEGWRRCRARAASPAGHLPIPGRNLEDGIVLLDGEVALGAETDPSSDPSLLVRLARAAASRNALVEVESLVRLQEAAVQLPEPWGVEIREAFLELCSAGDAFVVVAEALDQHHLFEVLIPEWLAVRNRPQRNAYHRYTVDRHLLEAVARTKPLLAEVSRPDLLLLGALLHDIGKGFPGDHSEAGKAVAVAVATRMGLPTRDIDVLAKVVAYHLVLPEVATRRDLDDPSTAVVVAKLLGDKLTLELLAALTEADSLATGTSAWGAWKAELVRTLASKVAALLDGGLAPGGSELVVANGEGLGIEPSLLARIEQGELSLVARGHTVTVTAPDRAGLLAAVAGTLALHGCNVRRAKVSAPAPGVALEVFDVEPIFERSPQWALVERDLEAALAGKLELSARLLEQDRTYSSYRRARSADPPVVRVTIDNDASQRASILEVRAPDRFGLLHQVSASLASAGVDVVAALVDTLGHEVIDTFYVRERDGSKLEDRERIERLCTTLEDAAREA